MVGVFRDTLGQCQIAPYSKMILTAITGLTATSTVAGQIVLTWSGGLGSNVVYSYVLSTGTVQSVGAITGNGAGTPYSVTLTLTSTNPVTTTVTLTATVLGGSTSVVSNSVTTPYNTPTDSMLWFFRCNTGDLINTGALSTTQLANYAPYNNGAVVSYTTAPPGSATAMSLNTTTYKTGGASLYYINADNNTTTSANGVLTSVNINIPAGSGMTYCCWIKTTSAATSQYIRLFSWIGTGGNYNYVCTAGSSPGYTTLMVVMDQSVGGPVFYLNVPVFDGNWHHFVLTNGGSSNTGWTVYVDNVAYRQTSSQWSGGSSTDLTYSYPKNAYTNQSAYVIGFGGGTLSAYYDDIRLYTRGLTSTEINAIYNSTT